MRILKLKQLPEQLPSVKALALERFGYGWAMLFAALIMPILVYGVFPSLGIGAFQNIFSIKRLLILVFLVAGGTGYAYYLRYVLARPHTLVYFYITAWPVVEYINNVLMIRAGVNLHLRPLLVLALAVPTVILAFQKGGVLFKLAPHLKYYLMFFGVLFLYFFFYNGNAVNATSTGADTFFSEGSISLTQLTSYMYCLLGMFATGITVVTHPNAKGFFDALNKTLLGVSIFESLITIAGYPFNWYSINLDGFHRAMGIFTHPNPFAHHMGLLMLYFLGLFCFYQGIHKHRMPAWLLIVGLLVNMVAFLLGLSKTALGVFSLCALILFLFNLSSPVVRRMFFKILVFIGVMIPIGLVTFSVITDQSFIELIQARLEEQTSFNWRVQTWNTLLSNMEGLTLIFGNGFTSASAYVFQMSYSDTRNANPLILVHNAYISLLYDLGMFGVLMFISALSVIRNAFRRMMQRSQHLNRPLWVTVISLGLYYLIVCGFDEMAYMFDAALLFWSLSTLLTLMALRERH